MSLIDLASMVLAPTAVKDGKVYNAIPNDQDFTFSRGTEATRVNSAGLIEKARTNRLLQSNNFNTSPYSPANATVTSGFEGYDGSNDAWKVASTTIGSETRIRQSQTFTTGEVITLSVYMKKGNVNFGIVRTYAITGGGRAWFDLENGTVATENSGINGSIEDVGNGWYRCSIWGVITTTGAVDIAPAPADGDYLADAVGEFIYIQDSQLESGLVATDYIETTTSSVTVGITDDLPRVDYTGGGCPSLLLEPSATALNQQSEYYNAYWTKENITISSNNTTSPEGVANASKINETASTTYFALSKGFTISSGSNHTVSVFAKADERNFLIIRTNLLGSNVNTTFNLSTGVVTYNGHTSASIESYSNGWYRCSITASSSSTSSNMAIVISNADVTSNVLPTYLGVAGSGLHIYGINVMASGYLQSYIPTYGTSTTRSADSCSLTNASNLIGQTEGTMFAEFIMPPSGTLFTHYRLSGVGGLYNDSQNITLTATNTIRGWSFSGTAVQANIESGVYAEGTKVKVAYAYKANDFILYINGIQIGTDTSGSVPSMSELLVGSYYPNTSLNVVNKTKQTILFPTRLTNDQLAELTK